ncbi:hypothetical protein BC936DRAFT_137549 [Jimgerdemannia flammicorona]|uniref:Uncharacterized protein n=1 Tax=Jimgerdemannia flammicorona TaxID=994334 RepID=A0A433DIZ3_9FUNG|nr:hypothetical protein BC936DRAFT_137549 [Jimgerdemannia flammicorona]
MCSGSHPLHKENECQLYPPPPLPPPPRPYLSIFRMATIEKSYYFRIRMDGEELSHFFEISSHENELTFEKLTMAIIEQFEDGFTLNDYIITCRNLAEDAKREVLKSDVVLKRALKHMTGDEALEMMLIKKPTKKSDKVIKIENPSTPKPVSTPSARSTHPLHAALGAQIIASPSTIQTPKRRPQRARSVDDDDDDDDEEEGLLRTPTRQTTTMEWTPKDDEDEGPAHLPTTQTPIRATQTPTAQSLPVSRNSTKPNTARRQLFSADSRGKDSKGSKPTGHMPTNPALPKLLLSARQASKTLTSARHPSPATLISDDEEEDGSRPVKSFMTSPTKPSRVIGEGAQAVLGMGLPLSLLESQISSHQNLLSAESPSLVRRSSRFAMRDPVPPNHETDEEAEYVVATVEHRSMELRQPPLSSVEENLDQPHITESPRTPLRRSKRPQTMMSPNYDVVAMMKRVAGDEEGVDVRSTKRSRTRSHAGGKSNGGSNGLDRNAPSSKHKIPLLTKLGFRFTPGDHYYAYKCSRVLKALRGDKRQIWKNFNKNAAREGRIPYMLSSHEWHPFLPYKLTLSYSQYLHWAKEVRKFGRLVNPTANLTFVPGTKAIRMFINVTARGSTWWIDLGWVALGKPIAKKWDDVPEYCIEKRVKSELMEFRICVPELLMDVPLVRVEVGTKAGGREPIVCEGQCRRDGGEVSEAEAEAESDILRRFTFCDCL